MLTQLDGDITFKFVLETNCVNARDSFDYSWFSMGYMANCTNINSSLTWDNFRR